MPINDKTPSLQPEGVFLFSYKPNIILKAYLNKGKIYYLRGQRFDCISTATAKHVRL